MRNENIVITRYQIGLIASIVGATGLILGIVGFLWQGSFTTFIISSLIVGGLGTALWALMTPSEFRAFIQGRQVRQSISSVFAALLLLGIVILAYGLAQRAVISMDMTIDNQYTLSDTTRQILRRVTRPMQITGFYSPRGVAFREIDDQFWRQYEEESGGLITRRYVDPDVEPGLRSQFQVVNEGEVFLSFVNPDGSLDMPSTQIVPRENGQERDMSQTISRMLIAGSVTVYFEVGHGEYDPEDSTQQGLSRINLGIQQSGLITLPLSLPELAASGGRIPDDASALIFARPQTDLSEAEVIVLDEYLQRGGSLFIMADAVFVDNPFLQENGIFSQYLWNNFGLRPLDAIVVDPPMGVRTPVDIQSTAVFTGNPIASRLDSDTAQLQFNIVRPIQINTTPPANTTNGQIILSSDQSFAERNLIAFGQSNTINFDDGQDIRGPFATVAWADNQATGAKILLTGDADFATNGLVVVGGNSILFTDGLVWLSGFADQLNFGVQFFGSTAPFMFASGQQLDFIAFLTVFLIPGVVLLSGLAIWYRRVRA